MGLNGKLQEESKLASYCADYNWALNAAVSFQLNHELTDALEVSLLFKIFIHETLFTWILRYSLLRSTHCNWHRVCNNTAIAIYNLFQCSWCSKRTNYMTNTVIDRLRNQFPHSQNTICGAANCLQGRVTDHNCLH